MTTPRRDNALQEQGEVGKTNNTQSGFCYPSPHSVNGAWSVAAIRALLKGDAK